MLKRLLFLTFFSMIYLLNNGQLICQKNEITFNFKDDEPMIVLISGLQKVTFNNEVSVEEEQQLTNNQSSIDVFPNPFLGQVQIKFDFTVLKNANAKILNIHGSEVYRFNLNQSGSTKELFWDGKNSLGEELPPGLYIIQINTGEKVYSKKLLKL